MARTTVSTNNKQRRQQQMNEDKRQPSPKNLKLSMLQIEAKVSKKSCHFISISLRFHYGFALQIHIVGTSFHFGGLLYVTKLVLDLPNVYVCVMYVYL